MRKRTIDPDVPVGKVTVVKDFLPPPHKLVFPTATVKVTISLNQGTIDFFKYQAKKHRTKYQKMIRAVLHEYVAHYNAA